MVDSLSILFPNYQRNCAPLGPYLPCQNHPTIITAPQQSRLAASVSPTQSFLFLVSLLENLLQELPEKRSMED